MQEARLYLTVGGVVVMVVVVVKVVVWGVSVKWVQDTVKPVI